MPNIANDTGTAYLIDMLLFFIACCFASTAVWFVLTYPEFSREHDKWDRQVKAYLERRERDRMDEFLKGDEDSDEDCA